MDIQALYARQQARHGIRVVTLVIYFSTALPYLIWRATVFNPDAPLFSLGFFAAELICFALACMAFFLSWKVRVRRPPPAPEGLSVDVFVPTYNESVEMLRLTLRAALEIDYPHETWLLDDGRRPEMEALAAELGCRYLTRPDNVGNKSGNLNHAMQHATGDYVTILDSDHVAQKNLLSRLLGYFEDPKLAFVQAPQDFYNLSAFQFRASESQQLLWQDQSVFYSIGQIGRDYWGAATCCGTGVVFRREALDDIGGFPLETVTEDMHLSIKMVKRGWRTAFHPEPLAYGVAPADLGKFLTQRLRWGQGNVQSFREEWVPTAQGMNWAQRICWSALAFIYVEGYARVALYLTPIVVLMTGIGPIMQTQNFFWFYLPYAFASFVCFEEMSRGNMRVDTNEQIAMARFPIYIASTFGLFLKRIRWRISSKEFVGHLPVYLLLPQFAILFLSLAAVAQALIAPPEGLRDYSPGIVGFVGFWALYNARLAWLVVRHAWLASKNKRPDYRFEVALPLSLTTEGRQTPTLGVVEAISTRGMTFCAKLPVGVDVGSEFAGRVFLPAGSVPFCARLLPIDERTRARKDLETPLWECSLDWASAEDADRLNLSLHSCDWHRRLVYQGEFFATPLERLGKWLGFYDDDGRRPFLAWRPALYTRPGRDGEEPRFAMFAEPTEEHPAYTLLFEELEADAHLELVLPIRREQPQKVSVVLVDEPPDPSATGLDSAAASVYIVASDAYPWILSPAAEPGPEAAIEPTLMGDPS